MRTGRVGEAADRVWPLAALSLGLVILGAAAASGHLFPDANPSDVSPVPTITPSITGGARRRVAGGGAGGSSINWLPLLVGAAVVLAAVLAFLALRQWAARRARRAPVVLLEPQPPVTGDPVRELRDDVLDATRAAQADVRAAADVRDAVIAAYLSFEAAVARGGVARLAHETSGELLARVLRSMSVPAGASRALVGLYERVRFGSAPSDEAMRTEAQQCLAAIEDALAGARR
ncbi:MAG: hypothetical protein QOF57_1939 [Frankiaceae bacterium]|nr:hypothetical protein [Frankiaceae bacterium]